MGRPLRGPKDRHCALRAWVGVFVGVGVCGGVSVGGSVCVGCVGGWGCLGGGVLGAGGGREQQTQVFAHSHTGGRGQLAPDELLLLPEAEQEPAPG